MPSTELRTADFSYSLPPELIATHPTPDRADSRLLVLDRQTGDITHSFFRNLPQFLRPDDLLVLNNSKVIPASLHTTDKKLSVLLLEETSPRHWVCLVKPGKKAQPGGRLHFTSKDGSLTAEAEVLKTLEGGERVLRFFDSLDLEKFGEMPLPPYIQKERKNRAENPSDEDWNRYQTVYAGPVGSVAAPTAGLHFTPELLNRFDHCFVTLHVGVGTFRPVKTDLLRDHVMHEETFSIPPELEPMVNSHRRLVAVGTTTTRVLESVSNLRPQSGRTRIFIHPPYTFRRVQALITNFHLPQSTLLMLVSAFAGREKVLAAYEEAVRERYRFFSYGDAMLIL